MVGLFIFEYAFLERHRFHCLCLELGNALEHLVEVFLVLIAQLVDTALEIVMRALLFLLQLGHPRRHARRHRLALLR